MADLHNTLVEIEIVQGRAVSLSPLVRRITANNAGPFTGPGTNTYLVGHEEVAVIDPGPNEPEHIEAILREASGRIKWVIATHAHEDHSPAAKPLAEATGAQLIGPAMDASGSFLDKTFVPDVELDEGYELTAKEFTLEAVYTPGHIKQHFCLRLMQEQMLFAGDHVMQGATVVIVPPHGGSMGAYMSSLQKLIGTGIQTLAPAHGHLLAEADQVIQELYDHRKFRENMVLDTLKQQQQQRGTVAQLAPSVYPEVGDDLIWGTYIGIWAHLKKLSEDGVVALHQEKGDWTPDRMSKEDVWEMIG